MEDDVVGVIYLSWIPYGISHFIKFINSYERHPAGHTHKLIFLFNGVNDKSDVQKFLKVAAAQNIKFEYLILQKGFDIDAYYFAAKKIKNKIIFFLNSYSEFQQDDWLKKMYAAFIQPGVGLAGCTASLQSHYTTILDTTPWKYETDKSLYQNFRKYKLLFKTHLLYSFYYMPFPNPHLRTNAFMIRRDIFLKLKHKKIRNKRDAYLFESGRNSLTNQIKKAGFIVLIVDKNGIYYQESDWFLSNTFWTKNQENVLITDNQTLKYMDADNEGKKMYTNLGWNKTDV